MAFSQSMIGERVDLVAKKHLRWVGTVAGPRLLFLSLPFCFGLILVNSLSLVADELLADVLEVIFFSGFEAGLGGCVGALFEVWLS